MTCGWIYSISMRNFCYTCYPQGMFEDDDFPNFAFGGAHGFVKPEGIPFKYCDFNLDPPKSLTGGFAGIVGYGRLKNELKTTKHPKKHGRKSVIRNWYLNFWACYLCLSWIYNLHGFMWTWKASRTCHGRNVWFAFFLWHFWLVSCQIPKFNLQDSRKMSIDQMRRKQREAKMVWNWRKYLIYTSTASSFFPSYFC